MSVPPRLYVLIGIPGSGKSTLAAQTNKTIVNPDSIRTELTGSEEDQSMDEHVFDLAWHRMRLHLLEGEDVVLDATNLDPRRRLEPLGVASHANTEAVAVIMPTRLAESLERNRGRERVVSSRAMTAMIGLFDRYCSREQLESEGFIVMDPEDAFGLAIDH